MAISVTPPQSTDHLSSPMDTTTPSAPGDKTYAEAADPAFADDVPKPVKPKKVKAPGKPSYADVAGPLVTGSNPIPSQPPVPRAPGNLSYADAVLATPPDSPKNPYENWNPTEPRVSQEFEGKGLDESPTTPTFGHRRAGSRSSPKLRGRGRDSPSPPPERVLEHQEEENQGLKGLNLSYESLTDGNGKKLTSIKPDDYEQGLKLVEKEKKEQDKKRRGRQQESELELTSGRQAAAGWEKSGIRWAPLNVPLKRRLQTAIVLAHTLSAFSLLAFFFFLCAIPIFWPLIVPYLIYVLLSNAGTSGNLKWRSERLRSSKIWSLFASYFPARLHRTTPLPATRKYIFGYHPHGIISHGAFAAFGTEALGFSQLFPGITNTLLTLDNNFRTPFYREYILSMGLASVSRESCENLLSKGGQNGEGMGRAITIVVGGARESLETHPGTLGLVLGRRKGFVKMAIRQGADLVPVLAFGENDIYEQLDANSHPRLHKFQLLFKKVMGFTVPVFHARGIFNYDVGMMPYRRPMNIVVGRPIHVQQQKGKPDEAYLDEIHKLYVEELQTIWDTWKDTFAKDRKGELTILD